MVETRSTGLAGLDSLLGGGILPGMSILCYGEPMNALDLMGFHFTAGAKKGEVAYFTTNLDEKGVIAGITAVGGTAAKLHVVPLPKTGKWTIPDPKPGMRYIIDSLSTVILNAGFDATLSMLERLKGIITKNGDNLLVMVTDGMHDASEITRLRMWADGVLQLGFDRQGFGLYPFMKLTKMRGIPDASRLLLVKETDRGISLDSTKRVF